MALHFRLPPSWPLYLVGALILSLALVTVVGERGLLLLWRLRGEKTQLDEQNYRLQQENEALRQRIARIRGDNSYLEKLAREELNLVRPGDVVYRFSKADPRTNHNNPADEVISDDPLAKPEKVR
ncbi:MAG TPA: septum formation initiator family protein [Candidatus Binatus sp.]|nr:septum formation initiator family protein [Candidatus Binatus sp.]